MVGVVMADPSAPETRWPKVFLRRADQATVAMVLAVSLLAMIVHGVYQESYRGRRIEVEEVTPGTIPFSIDINEADWPELTVLPGVGETLAKRIVESREQAGPFRDLDELRRVRGIGPRTLERLKPYLRPLPDWEATAKRKSGRLR